MPSIPEKQTVGAWNGASADVQDLDYLIVNGRLQKASNPNKPMTPSDVVKKHRQFEKYKYRTFQSAYYAAMKRLTKNVTERCDACKSRSATCLH